ncbi:MAG: hypothetical protein KAI47_08635 [Deltaproteobacteria bacterium]|nr:hypothetical protein [Deltaproteobacteria bacterium]
MISTKSLSTLALTVGLVVTANTPSAYAKNPELAKKLDRDFRNLEQKYAFRLGNLRKIDAGTRKYSYNIRTMTAEIKNAHKITRMLPECDAKFSKPKRKSCELARNWKKIYKGYLTQWVGKRVEVAVHRINGIIKAINNTGVLYGKDLKELGKSKKWIAEMKGKFTKLFDVLNIKLPPKIFAPIEAKIPEFKAALKKASKVKRWPSKSRHKNGSIKKAAVQAFRSAGLQVKRVGLEFPQWTIKKNSYGRPLYRFRNVTVMAKGRGEKFCRVYDGMSIKAQHKGGGRYAKPVLRFSGGERFLVSSCR